MFCEKTKRKGHFSPVDNALIFGHHSLEIGELEKAVMEIVQVEDTHKQEGWGNENPGKKHCKTELLQAEVNQAA